MKQLAFAGAAPSAIAALERALASGGASELDVSVPAAVWRNALAGPAAEFLSRPGKGLRASIVRAGWQLGGGAPDALPDQIPLVIEILHAGSLIVDDIEDASEMRRGGPALHQLVGVPLAINTGSWMYFWALAELSELGLSPAAELAAHRAAAMTLVRCHQGQALDLATRVWDLGPESIGAVVAATTRLKTGALCMLAAELGAISAGAPPTIVSAVRRFAGAMGTGLQMLDDLGSLTSAARRTKAREDLEGGRPTWPWAWLAEVQPFAWARCAALARTIATRPTDVDVQIDELSELLLDAIGAIARHRVRFTLDAALEELESAVGASSITEEIATELSRMEASYG
ncbi:MAG: polyprenyl synthetase family protein [Deltaproteobacteria bacterium]|nr:polyprenyl synthetase family protein [Deltaproteobacteria bacterium]